MVQFARFLLLRLPARYSGQHQPRWRSIMGHSRPNLLLPVGCEVPQHGYVHDKRWESEAWGLEAQWTMARMDVVWASWRL